MLSALPVDHEYHNTLMKTAIKRIVSISLGSSRRNYCCTITLLGQRIEIRHIGTNGNSTQAAVLARAYDGEVDVISLGPPAVAAHVRAACYIHPELHSFASQPRQTPIVYGQVLRATLERWAALRASEVLSIGGRTCRVLFPSGIESYQAASALTAFQPRLCFADPLLHTGLPFVPSLHSLAQLEQYTARVLPVLKLLPARFMLGDPGARGRANQRVQRLFKQAELIAGRCETILRCAPPALPGCIVLTDDPSPAEIEDLRRRGVAALVTLTQPLCPEQPFLAADVLEAAITAITGHSGPPDEADVLACITEAGWAPAIHHLSSRPIRPTFAFVVHPLTLRQIYSAPFMRVARYLPQHLVEWGAAFMTPVILSRIRGIRSVATGQVLDGVLLTLGATPREMMRRPPAFTYRRLLHAARRAEDMGARILGLGAFTSVVGDAGATVARRSPIGITSGNALTVAVALETARRALLAMGNDPDHGCVVVMGATGSIGAACARMLAATARHVVLVAPRPERLLALKQQIAREIPGANLTVATQPDAYLSRANLVLLATSALSNHLIDLDRLAPGAVVCDITQPPSVRQDDAERRPDVLVVECGEVLLPGEPDIGFPIGLEPGMAYACLAETILLALEGRFEHYTVGRNIATAQVYEMYHLMSKHGLRIAGLRSFGHMLSSEELAYRRHLAGEQRGKCAAAGAEPSLQAEPANC
jgi:predicted amino acid dehydrogenase